MVGYYLEPFVWVGGPPNPSGTPIIIDGSEFTATVCDTTLDAGGTRLGITVSRGGLVLFEFQELLGTKIEHPRMQLKEPRFSKFVGRILNLHLLCLAHSIGATTPAPERHPEGFGPYAIGPRDFWYRTISQGGHLADNSRSDVLSRRSSIPRRVFGLAERMSGGAIADKDFLVRSPHALKLNVIERSLQSFRAILAHEKAEIVPLACELLTKSYQAFFVDDDDDWALIIAWTAIESIIADVGNTLLENNRVRKDSSGTEHPFVNKTRRETLSDTRSFTSSVRIELLSFLGAIDIVLYEKITRVRKSRNAWVHRLEHVTPEDAQLAAETLVTMLVTGYGLSL